MEVRMESKTGKVLTGIDPVLTQIEERLRACPPEWLGALQRDPSRFADVEQEVHAAFNQMADQIVAGLLAEATSAAKFAQTAKKSSAARSATESAPR